MTLMDAAKAEAYWQMLTFHEVVLPYHLPPVGCLWRHTECVCATQFYIKC